ncbi:MAG TPA: hypothetical protein VIS96_17710 [Terrimicrobiaceae bacterium]
MLEKLAHLRAGAVEHSFTFILTIPDIVNFSPPTTFDKNMTPIRSIAIAIVATIYLVGCDQRHAQQPIGSQPSNADFNAAVERRAAQMLAEKQRQEELAAAEALRIAEERERLAMMAAEKREQIAADLSTREGAMEAKKLANLEQAATEMARRETAATEVKDFVDSLELQRSQINEIVNLRINGEDAKTDMALVSPSGYTIRYKARMGITLYFSMKTNRSLFHLSEHLGDCLSLRLHTNCPSPKESLPGLPNLLQFHHHAPHLPALEDSQS